MDYQFPKTLKARIYELELEKDIIHNEVTSMRKMTRTFK